MYNFLYDLILNHVNGFSLTIFTYLEVLNKKFSDSYKHLKYILDHFVQNSDHKI